MHRLALWWFLLISASSIFITAADKLAARCGRRRVPECVLMWLAVLGGGVAMYLTMRLIHHKTKKAKFMWGIPIIILLQATILFLLFRFH